MKNEERISFSSRFKEKDKQVSMHKNATLVHDTNLRMIKLKDSKGAERVFPTYVTKIAVQNV